MGTHASGCSDVRVFVNATTRENAEQQIWYRRRVHAVAWSGSGSRGPVTGPNGRRVGLAPHGQPLLVTIREASRSGSEPACDVGERHTTRRNRDLGISEDVDAKSESSSACLRAPGETHHDAGQLAFVIETRTAADLFPPVGPYAFTAFHLGGIRLRTEMRVEEIAGCKLDSSRRSRSHRSAPVKTGSTRQSLPPLSSFGRPTRALRQSFPTKLAHEATEDAWIRFDRVRVVGGHHAARAQISEAHCRVPHLQRRALPVSLCRGIDAANEEVRTQPSHITAEHRHRAIRADERRKDVKSFRPMARKLWRSAVFGAIDDGIAEVGLAGGASEIALHRSAIEAAGVVARDVRAP